ncbi:YkvA family protein [Pseudaminobacter salicylatoxidans]|uniref:YkvA family protein n=1 Tax=Pseudaminobacter salicylatoxidans TaxID=93369 RepID=UPI000305EA24|nr:YkvA family protein [Pseudaminobacter salicylatoxidans]
MAASGMTGLWNRLRSWTRLMKRDVVALWLAARDPRTPIIAKAVAAAVAAYAFSPIDLIPDFVPVLGYLDDVVIVPLGIMLAIWLIPPDLMAEFREAAAQRLERPSSLTGLAFILSLWLATAILLLWWLWPRTAL